MITKQDVIECLALAVAVFPQVPVDRSRVDGYYELLKDLPISRNELFEAVKSVLKISSFFPTVASIREQVRKGSNQPPQFNALELENSKAVEMPIRLRQMIIESRKKGEEERK